MPDCCHHGEGEHDKRDMAMPAMPGAGLVMVEPQFILGRLETILDRPAMTLDHDKGFDASSSRTPSGEEREVPISDVAADRRHPDWVVRPGPGQIQCPVDEGMAVARHISNRIHDLAIVYLRALATIR